MMDTCVKALHRHTCSSSPDARPAAVAAGATWSGYALTADPGAERPAVRLPSCSSAAAIRPSASSATEGQCPQNVRKYCAAVMATTPCPRHHPGAGQHLCGSFRQDLMLTSRSMVQ